MNEILRDSIWQFVGVIFGILAIVATVVIYLLQRSKKSLSYKIISNTPLLTANEETNDELQILYKGNAVPLPRILILKIENDGNQPVASGDFEKPLYFNLSGTAKVLSAEIISAKPDNLNPQIVFDANRVGVAPLLLNSKDSIKIKAIIDGKIATAEPDARIIGVKEIKDAEKLQFRKSIIQAFVAVSLLILLFLTFLFRSYGITATGAILYFGYIGYTIWKDRLNDEND